MKIVTYLQTMRTLRVNNGSTTVPIRVTSNTNTFKKAIIIGKKGSRTNNTGTIYLGLEEGNDTQPLEIAAGGVLTIEAPESQHYDWQTIYLDVATAGDGIIALYS